LIARASASTDPLNNNQSP